MIQLVDVLVVERSFLLKYSQLKKESVQLREVVLEDLRPNRGRYRSNFHLPKRKKTYENKI